MRIAPVYDFPPFDTGLFAAAEFLMSGGNARLLVKVEEHTDIILQFKRIRWHEFTALYNCSSEQVSSAFFKLVRLDESERLTKYIRADLAATKAYKELHHFRVFLHEHGCHELFAESFSAIPESGQWHQTGEGSDGSVERAGPAGGSSRPIPGVGGTN
jgi:hypothetical protein